MKPGTSTSSAPCLQHQAAQTLLHGLTGASIPSPHPLAALRAARGTVVAASTAPDKEPSPMVCVVNRHAGLKCLINTS